MYYGVTSLWSPAPQAPSPSTIRQNSTSASQIQQALQNVMGVTGVSSNYHLSTINFSIHPPTHLLTHPQSYPLTYLATHLPTHPSPTHPPA